MSSTVRHVSSVTWNGPSPLIYVFHYDFIFSDQFLANNFPKIPPCDRTYCHAEAPPPQRFRGDRPVILATRSLQSQCALPVEQKKEPAFADSSKNQWEEEEKRQLIQRSIINLCIETLPEVRRSNVYIPDGI